MKKPPASRVAKFIDYQSKQGYHRVKLIEAVELSKGITLIHYYEWGKRPVSTPPSPVKKFHIMRRVACVEPDGHIKWDMVVESQFRAKKEEPE